MGILPVAYFFTFQKVDNMKEIRKEKILFFAFMALLMGAIICYLLVDVYDPQEQETGLDGVSVGVIGSEALKKPQEMDESATNPETKTTEEQKTQLKNTSDKRKNRNADGKKAPTIDNNIEALRNLLQKPVKNDKKILALAHKMSQGTEMERHEALAALRNVGGRDAAREIIDNYLNNGGDAGQVNNDANEGDGNVGGGSSGGSAAADDIKEDAIDTLKHIIEESLVTGEAVMDKSSWLSVLSDMDYVTRYSYMVLLSQFDKSESVPVFLEMYDSEDHEIQDLSRLFVSMIANGTDMSDKTKVEEWMESFAVQEEEDDKVKAY